MAGLFPERNWKGTRDAMLRGGIRSHGGMALATTLPLGFAGGMQGIICNQYLTVNLNLMTNQGKRTQGSFSLGALSRLNMVVPPLPMARQG